MASDTPPAAPDTGKKPDTAVRQAGLERLKSKLIEIVGQEFKTPLHLASGYIGLLHDRSLGPLNDEQANAVETVRKQILRLSERLSDMQKIAQLEAGLAPELREPVSIGELVEAELLGFEEAITKRGLLLQMDIERGLPDVRGSLDFLRDVVRRLIDNAIHYTPSGGRVEIRVRKQREAGSKARGNIVLSVSDNGRGISADRLAKLFSQVGEFREIQHHAQGRSGLGFGLAICRHLVELHDGEITVESTVGKGSTFTVTLPLT